MTLLWKIGKVVVWSMILPIAALTAFVQGYDVTSSILAITALVFAWVDTVELPRRNNSNRRTQ